MPARPSCGPGNLLPGCYEPADARDVGFGASMDTVGGEAGDRGAFNPLAIERQTRSIGTRASPFAPDRRAQHAW